MKYVYLDMKMMSCPYYMLSSRKRALTRLRIFQIEYFSMSLKLILLRHKDIDVYTHPGLNAAPGVIFQFLLLKSICCCHLDCKHCAGPFQLLFSEIFLILRVVLKTNSWDIQKQRIGI